jgi:hypothetical protein
MSRHQQYSSDSLNLRRKSMASRERRRIKILVRKLKSNPISKVRSCKELKLQLGLFKQSVSEFFTMHYLTMGKLPGGER